MLPVSATGYSFTYPGTHCAMRGKLETINFHQFTCSWISVMCYRKSTDLNRLCVCVCVCVCKDLLTPFCLSIAQSCPPIMRNL